MTVIDEDGVSLAKAYDLSSVVRWADNRINRYSVDSVDCFVNTYSLDSIVSGG